MRYIYPANEIWNPGKSPIRQSIYRDKPHLTLSW